MFDGYQNIGDVALYYKVYGSELDSDRIININQPTLIFLHGGPGVVDHTLYAPFWSKFAGIEVGDSKLQVIFFDHRGNGKSYVMQGDKRDYGDKNKWNLDQWGRDAYEFFTRIGISKPIIAGVSFGGAVAISCATQFPNELSGLILCDAEAKFDLEMVIKHFTNKVREKNGTEEDVQKVCSVARSMFAATTPETYNEYVRTCLPYCATKPYNPELIAKCVKNEYVAHQYNTSELTSYNFISKLSSINYPVLILCGDQNPVHNVEAAMITANAIKSELLTFKLFEKAGSPVYADREDDVFQEVIGFMKNVFS